MATIAVLGTLDSKGAEHAFIADRIRASGHTALLIDVGTGGPPQVPVDMTREEVAAAGALDLAPLIAQADRGACVSAMSRAAPALLAELQRSGRIQGVISLGGGGGTAIATAAMRALPLGFPKLMVSTLASGNTAPYLGTSDISMMPSVVDVAGLNSISKIVFARAAGAICGMVDAEPPARGGPAADRRQHVRQHDRVRRRGQGDNEEHGYEVLVFHATGTGGRSMEALIQSRLVAGVLDITTTEWADEFVGGVLSAGPERLDAAAEAGLPAVVVPGCLDMVNFGEPASVPEAFAERLFYHHNPQVTLMRTTPAECAELGRILARKLNAYTAGLSVLLPRRGVSIIGAAGQPFHDPAADEALFEALTADLRDDIEVQSLDVHHQRPHLRPGLL